MSGLNTLQRTRDSLQSLKAAGLVAADTAGSLIFDCGSAPVLGDVLVEVTALEIASGDEHYRIIVQGSNSATFASGIEHLAVLHIGDGSAIANGVDVDNAVGKYLLPFRTEKGANVYRYVRIYTDVSGTIATGINYTAAIVNLQRMG